jgi:hypothetical protein
VTSMVPRSSTAFWYVSGVPHRLQNVRVTPGEDAWVPGVPAIQAKSRSSHTAHATDGEPAASRHDRQ